MIIKTTVPKLGDVMHYIGKPVKDEKGNRIGTIIDAVEDDGYFELSMKVDPDIKFNNAVTGFSMEVKKDE